MQRFSRCFVKADNGQHNITKEKKEIQSLNETFKNHFTIYSSPTIIMAQWSVQQQKRFPNCFDTNHCVH